MNRMFFASSFNGNLSAWNTSSVTDMNRMFASANSFNQDISGWDVSSVTSMGSMFASANAFSQNLGPWYVQLNSTHVSDGSWTASVTAQNSVLRDQRPSYSFATAAGCDGNGNFTLTAAGVLTINSAPAQSTYDICIGASGSGLFGTNNVRQVTLTATKASNSQPVAEAGANQTVNERSIVTLNGSSSSDPDGDTLTYIWAAPAAIALSGATTATPSFTAPDVTTDTPYTITLNVTDGQLWDTDTVTITVRHVNRAPTANAGADQSASERTTVTLNGSSSSDPDGDTLTYIWAAPAAIALSGATTATPSFTAPDVTTDTPYTITLNVTDGQLWDTDTVTVTVREVNRQPTAEAGDNQTVDERTTVTLNGTGSSDPDNDGLTYSWTSLPAIPALQASGSAMPSFTAPEVASDTPYTITLNVTDGTLHDTDTVTITVQHVNRAPTAEAGANQTVDEGDTVTLDGSNSSDPDNDAIAYAWETTSGITLQKAATATPSFEAPQVSEDAQYNFTLTVSDGRLSSTDTVTVTVQDTMVRVPPTPPPPPNSPPSADAGDDQTVDEGDTVTLDGSNSSDPDGSVASYDWSAPQGITLRNGNTAAPSFTAPAVSADTGYTLTLTVTDDDGATDADTVTVTVRDVPPTSPLPPAAPLNLAAANTTTNTVTLSWDDPGDPSITGYRILYRVPAAQPALVVLVNDTGTPSATAYTASGLDPATAYEFGVAALNGSGASPVSNLVTVSTLPAAPPRPPPTSGPDQGRTVVTADSGDANVCVPSGVAHAIVLSLPTYETADSISVTLPGSLGICTSYNGTAVSVTIPANATVSGPPGWNGEILLPASASAGALESIDALGRITGIVTIGLPNGTLAFDLPVRITFEGRAGDRAAFLASGDGADAMLITERCESGDPVLIREQLGRSSGGQCVRDSSGDLEVWTNHFSSIASIAAPKVCR